MPDSQTLLVAEKTGNRFEDRLAIYDVEGHRVRIIPTKGAPFTTNAMGMSVRPDAKKAVITSMRPGPLLASTDLLEVDLSTGVRRAITSTPDIYESAPVYVDYHQLLYVGGAALPEPNGRVVLLQLPSGREQFLTPANQVAESATSTPDGRSIVYDAFSSGEDQLTSKLWKVRVDSPGSVIPLVDIDARYPDAYPDGRRLLVLEVGVPGNLGPLVALEIPGSLLSA